MRTAPHAAPTDASQRIGLFGGAFDPPHMAHHALAQAAVQQFALDRLWVLPTGQAWHKSRTLTPATHRLAMAQLAFQDLPKVQVDDREMRRTGPTYTFDTLTELKAQHPQAQLFLFIGSDQVQAFQSWHQWQGILALATVVEARRHASDPQWHNTGQENAVVSAVLHMPDMPCNATEIRASMTQQQPLTHWLSPDVWQYIQQHGLYLSPSNQHLKPT